MELPAEVVRADSGGLSTNSFRPLLDMRLLTSGDAFDATERVLKASCVPSASASCVFRFGRANLFGSQFGSFFSHVCNEILGTITLRWLTLSLFMSSQSCVSP